jgi:hypothetical protein
VVPPALPCPAQATSAFGAHLYLLGRCGVVAEWDPSTGASSMIPTEKPLEDAYSLALAPGRLAVLGDSRRTIRLYDMRGKLLRELNYSGDTQFTNVATTAQAVVASTYYDRHLLMVYSGSSDQPTWVVANPRYWPDRSPRYSSFVLIKATDDAVYAFDLLDFSLYVLDPKRCALIATYQKEPHPLWHAVTKPTTDSPHGGSPHFTGTVLAVSSTVAHDHLYVLMADRTLGPSAKPDDGYLEIASSRINEKGWKTLVRLTDRSRYAGSQYLSVIGETAYVLKPGGVVLAIPLAGT